jgi:hypothetical protein
MNITDLLDRPIAYHRIFVTLTGSVKAAILLSQAMYWQKRAKQSDGWWYKTAEEWTEETGLTRHEQDTAREACKNYLKTDLRDAPARLYWHVDDERLSADLFAVNGQSSLTKIGKLDSRNSSNINKNAETTTETTTPAAKKTDETPAEYNAELFRGDYRDYPEHLWEYARVLRDTWMFRLPEKPHKKKSKGQYAFYVMALDAIKDACAEFGTEVLVKVHTEWKARFRDGIAPYTIAQPTSLINVCAGKARELRDKKPVSTIPEELLAY